MRNQINTKIIRSYIASSDKIKSIYNDRFKMHFECGIGDFTMLEWVEYGYGRLTQKKVTISGVDRYESIFKAPKQAVGLLDEFYKYCNLVCVHHGENGAYYAQGIEWELSSKNVLIRTFFKGTKLDDKLCITGVSKAPLFIGDEPHLFNFTTQITAE